MFPVIHGVMNDSDYCSPFDTAQRIFWYRKPETHVQQDLSRWNRRSVKPFRDTIVDMVVITDVRVIVPRSLTWSRCRIHVTREQMSLFESIDRLGVRDPSKEWQSRYCLARSVTRD